VDDRGNLLAGGDEKTGTDATAAGQDSSTTGYEDRLRQHIESILASVVGAGHVRVQVAADMNYNHSTTTSESYDPDSKVIRSTQTIQQNSSDTNGATGNAVSVANALPGAAQTAGGSESKSNSDHSEETTNYEISKTVKTSTEDGGNVKKLSVAVVVDGAGDGKDYKARTPAEMTQITSLVKSAMGFDQARGDQLQVTNMQFARVEAGDGSPASAPLLGLDSAYWFKIIEASIMCVTALLIGLFVARPLIARMFAPNPVVAATQVAAGSAPVAGNLSAPAAGTASAASESAPAALPAPVPSIDISRIEGQVRESSIKKIGEVVEGHPEEALAIIRTWLHQPV
jgi:flagellar M-ring protein FliF